MEKLTVKYRNGECGFQYKGASAAMVRQVLDKIREDLRPICGQYHWSLEDSGYINPKTQRWVTRYTIMAQCGREAWIEATGASPGKALAAWIPARTILRDKYGITTN